MSLTNDIILKPFHKLSKCLVNNELPLLSFPSWSWWSKLFMYYLQSRRSMGSERVKKCYVDEKSKCIFTCKQEQNVIVSTAKLTTYSFCLYQLANKVSQSITNHLMKVFPGVRIEQESLKEPDSAAFGSGLGTMWVLFVNLLHTAPYIFCYNVIASNVWIVTHFIMSIPVLPNNI